MFKSFKILRSYYSLSKVKWQFVLLEFLVLLVPSLLSILSPILTANVISSITVYDFKNAIFMLSLDFAIIVVTAILYLIYHFFSSKLSKDILINTSEYVYDSIKQNKNINKINSSTMSNIWTFSTFNSGLLYKLCFFIKAIIILAIIFFYNYLIALALIIVSLISALLLAITNKQIQKNDLILTNSKVKSLELFNSIQKGISLDNNNLMENTMRYKFFDSVENSVKTNNKITLFYNLNNNFISLILKTATFLSTFYLITLIKSTYLTLSVFLVLTPYLTSSAQNLIAFFEIFPEIGIIDNIIKEFESLKTKQENEKNNSGEIQNFDSFRLKFYNATLKTKDYSIFNLNLEFPQNSLFQIIGTQNCGKRAIYDLISKKEQTTTGSVFLGNKNINDIPTDIYNKIVYFTYKLPYFYNLSIFDNLLVVSNNKSKISRSIKELGLNEMINSLPKKLDTIIDENFSHNLMFLLGLLRAYLTEAKIICIYEIPDNLNENEYNHFIQIIRILNERASVIIFTHEEIKEISNSEKIYIEKFNLKQK